MTERKRERRRAQGGSSCGPRPNSVQAANERGPASLTPEAISALNTALADERNASATYQVILERFGDVRPFSNIIHAEARHIEALHRIYERYGVRIAVTPGKVDATTETEDLATLCKIAAAGEVENTRLYDEVLLPAVSDYRDIAAVFARLRYASWNNHRPAFERCARRLGR